MRGKNERGIEGKFYRRLWEGNFANVLYTEGKSRNCVHEDKTFHVKNMIATLAVCG